MAAAIEFTRLKVVLVGTRNPLNIGAAARAMSNFGFSRLRVVHPYEEAFRDARSAIGASGILENAEAYGSLADAVADCSLVVGTTTLRNRERNHRLEMLPGGATIIRDHLMSGHAALLFGSEKVGLSNEDLSHCHWLLRIPTREEHVSMNLGQAVAVCLYELARNGAVERQSAKEELATAENMERITAVLLRALRASGYLGADSAISSEEKVRRLVRRMNVSAEDSEVWLGMLRQMLWKCEQERSRS